MIRFVKTTALTSVGFFLVACAGGSGIERNNFVLASTQAGVAGSGLEFADETTTTIGETLTVGDSYQVRFARYQNIEGEDDLDLILSTETVTLVDDGAGGVNAEITFNGETVSFPYDPEFLVSSQSVLANGQELIAFDKLGADYARAIGLYTYSADGDSPADGDLNSEGTFVIGIETDPSILGAGGGTATYTGAFDGAGGVSSSEDGSIQNEVVIEGDITLNVDFGASTIGGSLENGVLSGDSADEDVAFTGAFAATDIDGNSFASDLDITCEGTVTCTSDSELGGAFYGPNGEEIAGIIAFDVTGTNSETGETARFVAGAGFAAE